MTAFILTKKYRVPPFVVNYVAQNEVDGTELIAAFSIKHVADWPEVVLEEYVRIATKNKMTESLLKKQGGKPTQDQTLKLLKTNGLMNTLLGENGIVEDSGRIVWDTLSTLERMEIVKAWTAWTDEVSVEEVK